MFGLSLTRKNQIIYSWFLSETLQKLHVPTEDTDSKVQLSHVQLVHIMSADYRELSPGGFTL